MAGSQNNNNIVLSLYRQNITVFRTVDVAMLSGETNRASLTKKLNYHVSKGRLLNPRKGIYNKPESGPDGALGRKDRGKDSSGIVELLNC